MSLGTILPIVLFLVLGVVGLYALQVAKNVAYVAFVIMFGMATWYVGAPLIRHYILNEQAVSRLPEEEGKVARDIIDTLNNTLPSKEQMDERFKPAMDEAKKLAESGVSGELHAAAEGGEKPEEEKSLLDKILKAVFQTIADSF